MKSSLEKEAAKLCRLSARFDWWWHEKEFIKDPYEYSIRRHGPSVPWRGQRELAFFAWELIRRIDSTLGPPSAWGLGMYEEQLLLEIGGYRHWAISRSTNPAWAEAKEPGWSPVDCPTQWNLRATDAELVREFRQRIRQWRGEQRIPEPAGNPGPRHRPPSWRWLELLDISAHGCRPLNDGERRSLSEARRKGKLMRDKLVEAVRGIRAGDRRLTRLEGGFDLGPEWLFPRISLR